MSVARLGLIGVGRWGSVYLRTIQAMKDRCVLSHVSTTRPEALPPLPGTEVVSDWKALLTAPCDAVIIATPPDQHPSMLEGCLEAGKPCIVEKPLCLNGVTAQHLLLRAKGSAAPVLVNHIHLFSHGYKALRQLLHERGEPIRALIAEGGAFGPFRTHTQALWDWAPHDLAMVLDLFQQDPAQVAALAGPRNPFGGPEMAAVRLGFPNGSAWIHTGSLVTFKRRKLTVITPTRVYLLRDALADTPLQVAEVGFDRRYEEAPPEPLPWTPIPVAPGLPMNAMLEYFLDGLAGGDRSRFGLDLACAIVRLLALCDDAMGSARRR